MRSHLKNLESESIFILREAFSESKNPVMLYSIGKDSSVMLHLAKKAFYPGKVPFPLLHVDTKWKFQQMYTMRDKIAKDPNVDLIVYSNPEGIKKNINPIDHGSEIHTDVMKTQALKQALKKYEFDIIFGGARRDEEKSRSKERIFSFRTKNNKWDPKNQRPELWDIYNTRINKEESIRVFPLSDWTELDIWEYIKEEKIEIVPLYFSQKRDLVLRDNMLILVDDDRLKLEKNEKIISKNVRFRTLGCYPLTGAIESNSKNLSQIISELRNSSYSERQGRLIDLDKNSSMEKKKENGYF